MKVRSLLGRFAFGILLTSTAAGWAIEPPPAGEPAPPSIAAASSEGQDALQGFTLHEGWKGELFAAEPVTVNPVAFYVDDQGRVYVCESFRQNRGVTDNRGHDQAWLDDDLAAQSVEDRLQYHLKHLKDKVGEYTKYDDRIRLLEDRDGDGRADRDTVFADHFNQIVDGSGAGVLARGGNVYFTCIPHLWLLRDDNNDGQADVRKSLHNGYGVRVAFRGHDLHGLTIGPDGMLYFSIGDRGYNITTPNGQLVNPESGAVFRCELDGSGLEVFATGLRNPQELAFDDHGNLFTGDNNSDSGDKARWVYVVEGGDTGWRMAYQYLSDRGPFNREKIWHPYHPGQPAYIVPPIANFADGPSGLDYYPGTGLSDDWRGTFFLCDFRGTPSNSGVRTLRAKPKGAFFEVADAQQPIWKVLATDVQFGPDGSIYVSDWVNGWNGEGKGRIYRFFDPAARNSDAAKETARLLGEGMSGRTSAELVALLGHADQRVRLEAQFALADNRDVQSLSDVVGDSSAESLARMHAAWGLGQIARHAANSSREDAAKSLAAVVALLNDGDEELRAQAAKVVGRAALESATPKLIELLQDDSARVRYFAAMGLAKIGDAAAVPALTAMLAENDNVDPILRHGGIMGLAGVQDPKSLEGLATHPSSAVRLAAVVALRKRQAESVADYLNDADPLVVLEAARAIHDMPIPAALPRLAALVVRPSQDDALLRRVLNANFRVGGAEQAAAVAEFAARESSPAAMRLEALRMLGDWAEPSSRDRVLGMWRPLGSRDPQVAVEALKRSLPSLLTAPDEVRNEAVKIAAALGIREISPTLHAMVANTDQPPRVRADSLGALTTLKDAKLRDAIERGLADRQPLVRDAARRALAQASPAEALPLLEKAIEADNTVERQGAMATLAGMESDGAARVILGSLDRLLAGKVPADTRLDVLEAAATRSTPAIAEKLAAYEATRKDDSPAERYRETLVGGDAERGRRIFFERTEVSCVRCHKIDEIGGEVGPNLSKIATDKKRDYLLESIVDPNKAIAKGFDSVMLLDDDGKVHVGILKQESDDAIQIMTAEGKLESIPTDSIDVRRQAKSAMPEDLTKHLTRQDVRDLIEFLSERK